MKFFFGSICLNENALQRKRQQYKEICVPISMGDRENGKILFLHGKVQLQAIHIIYIMLNCCSVKPVCMPENLCSTFTGIPTFALN